MCDEYCCTHGCNQGRDCPARKERDPLRGAPWRYHLKDLARSLLLCLAVMMVAAVTVGLMTGCAAKRPAEKCGEMADGSQFCVIFKGGGK